MASFIHVMHVTHRMHYQIQRLLPTFQEYVGGGFLSDVIPEMTSN